MSGTGDNPNEAAERLERALERIARATASLRTQPAPPTQGVEISDATKEKLDGLIGRLRASLAEPTR